jgi:hypothetical protein
MATASSHPGLAFAKPEPRAKSKARAKRQEAALIAKVRADVVNRCAGRCELCGYPFGGMIQEMHHDPPRSATRGQAPERRHTLSGCCLAHRECHRKVTERSWAVRFDTPLLGFNGGYQVLIPCPPSPVYVFRQEART